MNDKLELIKNILEIDFQKNLQIASGSIVVAFTYFIGLSIAMVSRQVHYKSFIDMGILSATALFVLGLSFFFFIRSVRIIKRTRRAFINMEVKGMIISNKN